MKAVARLAAVALCMTLVQASTSACSDSSSSGSSSTSGQGARSATCLAFQDAACDWAADRCQSLGRAACDDSFQSLFCKADAVMQGCINAYATAACGKTPDACLGVADPAPAQQACNQFVDQVCTVADRCKAQAKSSCVADASAALPCGSVIGASPRLAQCQADLTALACPAPGGKLSLPDSCSGVLKTSSSPEPVTPGSGWHVQIVSPAALEVR